MDPFKLAELPLATLIMVAFFYVVFEMFKWAAGRFENNRIANNFADKFRYHVAFNHGVFVRTLGDVAGQIADLEAQAGAGPATPPTHPVIGCPSRGANPHRHPQPQMQPAMIGSSPTGF